MLYNKVKNFCLVYVIVFNTLTSMPGRASMSGDVVKAMDQANFCKKAAQELVFLECMRRNNEFIRSAIKQKSQSTTDNFPSQKKKKITKGIDTSIKSKIQICMDEQARISRHSGSDRRQEYCLYENMLEVLINIERNIEIFAR